MSAQKNRTAFDDFVEVEAQGDTGSCCLDEVSGQKFAHPAAAEPASEMECRFLRTAYPSVGIALRPIGLE